MPKDLCIVDRFPPCRAYTNTHYRYVVPSYVQPFLALHKARCVRLCQYMSSRAEMSICIESKTTCVGYLRLWPPSSKFTSPVRPFRNKPACNRSTCVEEVNTNACQKHTKAIKHDTNEIQVDCQQVAMRKRHPWQTENLRGTVSTVTYESIRRDNLWLIFDWKASLTSHHDLMWACWNDIMIRMKITRKKVPQQQPQHLRWQGRSREGMTPKCETLKAQRGEVGVLMVSHQIIHTCWG